MIAGTVPGVGAAICTSGDAKGGASATAGVDGSGPFCTTE